MIPKHLKKLKKKKLKIKKEEKEGNKIEVPKENQKKVEAKSNKKAYYVMDYFSRGLLYSYYFYYLELNLIYKLFLNIKYVK